MNTNQVVKILKDTLALIKNEALINGKNKLSNIIEKYELTIQKIEDGTLKYNEIHNSVKAYLEIYNDYDNPLIFKMSDAEKAVSIYLEV
ncbi:hypothetical protein C7434_4334 [Pantoea sp. PNA 14-12]|uniref:hypothetical protein n=1 Tax=Pantoea TaxID=53335 RepID=UPI00050E2AC1|nr:MULTISPECIES: hypothetical protein [Pantoea]KGD84730.1 hypothetical protein HA47_04775 [Pantoea stewartii subsp. indologenes]TDS65157.1 hypothetical protein C7434_4334 [Pantoea sp. PNA 14-12]